MFQGKSEVEAKKYILDMVGEYCDTFHNQKKSLHQGIEFLMHPEYMTEMR